MRLCSIASGSSGNCIYVGSEETHVLVDTGISGKRIEQGLNQLELTGRDIDAILVTHERSGGDGTQIPHSGLYYRWNCRCDQQNEEYEESSGRHFS